MMKIIAITLALTISSFSYGQQAQQQKTNDKPVVLQLESTIRGSREQPKVMSIVPWQPPTEKQALPSLILQRIDQEFVALDREEFQLRVQHYEKLSKK